MEQRMSDTVLVAIVVGVFSLAASLPAASIAFYAQARRENTKYERSQQEAKIQRVRSAYRLALQGADTILRAAVEGGYPLPPEETLYTREERLNRNSRTGADMLNEALIE